MTTRRDEIYRKKHQRVSDFVFDAKVAQVFDDMLNRSIPGYKTIVSMLAVLAQQYAQDDSCLYDLGCSHGVVTALMRSHVRKKNCRIIAVDNSAPLMEQCRQKLRQIPGDCDVTCVCEDVCAVSVADASVIVMNFILQFLSPAQKTALIQKIYQGLKPGGALLLSEKVVFADASQNAWQHQHHHVFKKAQGYSDLEIAQKQEALKNVLHLDTFGQHQARLAKAGFVTVYQWYQCFNFISLLAVKP